MTIWNIQSIIKRRMRKFPRYIGQATMFSHRNLRNFRFLATHGTHRVKNGKRITSKNSGSMIQELLIHFGCHRILDVNHAINKVKETDVVIGWSEQVSSELQPPPEESEAAAISFSVLRELAEKEDEIHLRAKLSKSVSKC